jgi:hypothetical protein
MMEARSTPVTGAKKRPSALLANPAVRDSQGKASRAEIRREEPRRAAPRNTVGTAERGNQRRSHKSGRKAAWPPMITLKLSDGSLRKGRLSDFREASGNERKKITPA